MPGDTVPRGMLKHPTGQQLRRGITMSSGYWIWTAYQAFGVMSLALAFFFFIRVARGTGQTRAVLMACRLGDIEEVRYLLRTVPWLAQQPDANGLTPLHVAALGGRSDIVHLLLRYKADPNQKNSSGMTPLHAAAMAGHVETARLLLLHGARPNDQDQRGNTPLYCAAWDGNEDMVDLLLEHGADLHIRTEMGESVMDLASGHRHEGVMGILERAGAVRLGDVPVKRTAHPSRRDHLHAEEGEATSCEEA